MVIVNELFNSKTIKRLCSDVKISVSQKKTASEWLKLLESGQLEKEKQNDIDGLEKKNIEIENLRERIDDLEYGITARNSSYKSGMLASGDDKISKGLIAMFGMWFEMRATDDKRKRFGKRSKTIKAKNLTLMTYWAIHRK